LNRPVLNYNLDRIVTCLQNAQAAASKGLFPGDAAHAGAPETKYRPGEKGFAGMSYTKTELKDALLADGMTVRAAFHLTTINNNNKHN
jgi:hypothetical protein